MPVNASFFTIDDRSSAADLGLRDRVCLVTGGSRGLGRAAAQVLTDEGAKVVVTGRSSSVADADHSLRGDAHAVGVVADNGDPASAETVVNTARRLTPQRFP
jgi:3-oxoacyl-[acyl-carrier protein] reductase